MSARSFFAREFNDIPNLEITAFNRQLLVDFVQSIRADVIIRGLRAVSDFDYEFQMTMMNRRLNNDLGNDFSHAERAIQLHQLQPG